MYSSRTSLGRVDVAFTDRHGGVSPAPYDALNLALASADDPAAVAENHRLLLADFAAGAVLQDMRQVHGADVVVADEWVSSGQRPSCDGVVSTAPDVVLMARAADCVPVVLADPDVGVIAAAHAGRPGVLAGVVPATLARMREHGAQRITAWIGPHVCGSCYEVPEDMREEVAAAEPSTRATTSWGTPSLDLGAGVRAQLERDDVTVVDLSRCTRESVDLYSHRRDAAGAGRHAGLIRRNP